MLPGSPAMPSHDGAFLLLCPVTQPCDSLQLSMLWGFLKTKTMLRVRLIHSYIPTKSTSMGAWLLFASSMLLAGTLA